jgi:hypothetical protein
VISARVPHRTARPRWTGRTHPPDRRRTPIWLTVALWRDPEEVASAVSGLDRVLPAQAQNDARSHGGAGVGAGELPQRALTDSRVRI